MPSLAARLAGLGLTLPPPVSPLGNYVAGVRAGNLLFLSGHGPLRQGGLPAFRGRVGAEFTAVEARAIAEGAVLNVLASAQMLLGDLATVRQVVHVSTFVACAPDAADAESVADACGELLVRLFGSPHARTAVGVVSLPNNVPVLVELVLCVGAP
jgi:enamine deaminase RidA (YjgF/YER057c/UK114 family)